MEKQTGGGAKPVLIVAVTHDELRRLLLDAFDFNAADVEIVTADSAEEALVTTQSMSVSGVLLDIALADITGLETVAKFRTERPQLDILVIADGKSFEVHELCMEMGVALYFERPVQLSIVAEKVQTLLNAERVGFRSLQGLTLPDIIQLLCEYEQSVQLRLISDQGSGTIVLQDGEIVHAQTKESKGEDAFFEICLWNGGSFELVHVLRPENKSILVPRAKLLLAAVKVLAEFSDKRSVTGWYSVSGFKARRSSEVPRIPILPTQAPGSSIGAATARSAGDAASSKRYTATGQSMLPPSAVVEVPDSPGPVIPSELAPQHIKPVRGRAVPLAVQFVAYGLILGMAGWTIWQWRLSRDAEEELAAKTEAQQRQEVPKPIMAPKFGYQKAPEGPGICEVRIAPLKEFSESGYTIVVAPDVFAALGLAENPWLTVRGPTGVRMGAMAMEKAEVSSGVVYLRDTIAKALRVQAASPMQVFLETFEWPEGPVKEEAISFSVTRTLPEQFSESLYAAGVSLDIMKKAGMHPGAYALVQASGGFQSVRIQLMDRGNPREIWLSKPARDALGVSGNLGKITLLPKNES